MKFKLLKDIEIPGIFIPAGTESTESDGNYTFGTEKQAITYTLDNVLRLSNWFKPEEVEVEVEQSSLHCGCLAISDQFTVRVINYKGDAEELYDIIAKALNP